MAEAGTSLHGDLGMTDEEYDAVAFALGREPNPAELMMYSVMWSEHCSYKSSQAHLGVLPSEGERVVVGPGGGAGIVDLGDGVFAALRIESHNHPSFVEPYQGAATGVGGILRDVLSMGARPVALWNQIRFGDLEDPHNRYLFGKVVAGIAGYGNAVGVPTLGGEVAFEPCFDTNPLVNVMCLGLLESDDLVLAGRVSVGDTAILLGPPTGRDGIGGASTLASASFSEEDQGNPSTGQSKRPSVQVGDPFAAKKMIEACLELTHHGLLTGLQDLGAAGISCATSETAAAAGVGVDLQLDAMPNREEHMTSAELLVSESQERMLAVVSPENLKAALDIAQRWEIDASTVGSVVAGGDLRVINDGWLAAEVPAASLADGAPLAHRPSEMPDRIANGSDRVTMPEPEDAGKTLLLLLDFPSLADASWMFEQYDHMLGLNTLVPPGHDAALLRVRGTNKSLAISTDGNSRRCWLDPRQGAARLVHEAALNVAVAGAAPLAVVDNLNFGSPEKPEVMWQFIETVAGLAEACAALGVPVIGGNVSFYNGTSDTDIMPTPVVGMLGLADPTPEHPPRLDAAKEGMELWLFGQEADGDFAASAYCAAMGVELTGRPGQADHERGLAAVATAQRLVTSGAPVVHDLSDGGLAIALAEICIKSQVGASIEVADWQELFTETPHRFIAALEAAPGEDVVDSRIGAKRIGTLGATDIHLGSFGSVSLAEATSVWRNAIPRRMARVG